MEKLKTKNYNLNVKTRRHKSIAVLSFGYWFGVRSLGLLIHPYQSVRALVRDDFYKPLVWLPGLMLAMWWFLGFLISWLPVLSKFGLSVLANGLEKWGATQLVMSFVFVWGVIFFVVWQILLTYLWVRMKEIR